MDARLGIQLYQFSKAVFEADKQAVLESLSAYGYHGVEGLPAYRENYSDICQAQELQFLGPHIVSDELLEIDSLIEYCLATGAQHVISSGPLTWQDRSEENYLKTATVLNQAAQKLEKHNILLHYHNHEFEFELLGEAHRAFDVLLSATNQNVDFCVDLGWVARAGVNPVHCLRANANRISYVHLRDFAGERSVSLGSGDLDIGEIVKTIAELPGIQYVVVEQDPDTEDPFVAAKTSIDYLRSIAPELVQA